MPNRQRTPLPPETWWCDTTRPARPLARLAEVDDRGAVELLAAVCRRARKDAQAGRCDAQAWLDDLATARPRSLRMAA